MMPKANPDVTLHIPQTQFQVVQTRLTDYLIQSQYAFVQSFSGGLDTIFDIFFDHPTAAALESLQLLLCSVMHGSRVAVIPDQTPGAVPPPAHLATQMERLVAVCIASP